MGMNSPPAQAHRHTPLYSTYTQRLLLRFHWVIVAPSVKQFAQSGPPGRTEPTIWPGAPPCCPGLDRIARLGVACCPT